MESKFKVMALGGLDENGKNCYVIETAEDIIVIEAGSTNFNNKSLGIDIVIPDFNYLIKNKDKVRAILISHGHFDQMGAISYLIEQLNVPVYASSYTIEFLKHYVNKKKYKMLKELKYSGILRIGQLKIEPFSLSHAIYGNFGFVIANDQKEAIVYATDFNFDQTANRFGRTDIRKIVELSKKYQVKGLMVESVSADSIGMAAGDQSYHAQFARTVESVPGRLIVSLYSSNLAGMTNIIRMAEEYDKKIVIIGRDLLNYVNIARNANYISHKKELFIRISDINKYDENQLIIVVAGLYLEPFTTLAKMATNRHNIIKINERDTILIASKPYDEIEANAQDILDVIARTECEIKSQKINVASHAYQEDIKMLINLFEPETIIPIKGEYRKFKIMQELVANVGIGAERVKILKNGDQLEIHDEFAIVNNEYTLEPTLISNTEDEPINPIVLRDREILSDNGYVLLVLTFLKGKQEIIQEPEVISGGLIQFDNDEDLIAGCKKIIKNELEKDYSNRELVTKLKTKVSRYLQNNIGKTPIVLPVRMEVDPKRIKRKKNEPKKAK